ncbi:MAG: integrin alpha [Planctomycetota bacterium]|jgi:hypothetical protein|nr:integrin alpha [Planctomycetota bacterium]MDP6940688.1 integrin alpha [Planctomycetota bacterium]
MPQILSLLLSSFLLTGLLSAQSAQLLYEVTGVGIEDGIGDSVSSLGDLDGDGIDDFIVGAAHLLNGYQNSGGVFLFSGASGTPLGSYINSGEGHNFGFSVATIGDLDGDSIPEYIVGAPGTDAPYYSSYAGKAYVFSGGPGTVLRTHAGEQSGDLLGYSVKGIGDLNDDGISDYVIGAPKGDGSATDSGVVYAYSGSTGSLLMKFKGAQSLDFFGNALDTGHIDTDRFQDLLVGAKGIGASSSNGYVSAFSGKDGSTFSKAFGTGTARLGVAVAILGDIDQDGLNDFLGTSPSAFFGGIPGYGMVKAFSSQTGSLLYSITPNEANADFGKSACRADDIDQDGIVDFIIGAPDDNGLGPPTSKRGAYFCFSGATGNLLFKKNGLYDGDLFGSSVALLDDLDQDGIKEIVSGAPTWNVAQYSGPGTAYVFTFTVPTPNLNIYNFFSGAVTQLGVTNCTPNKVAVVLWSVNGGGPFSSNHGDFLVTPPFKTIYLNLNEFGNGGINKRIPNNSTGLPVWFHGIDVHSGILTNNLALTIG